jgi:hypothetical protein
MEQVSIKVISTFLLKPVILISNSLREFVSGLGNTNSVLQQKFSFEGGLKR